MALHAIHTEAAPAAIGPYNQGVVAGDLLFTSMQIGLEPESGELAGTTSAAQMRQCLDNVLAIVARQGSAPADVIKVTVYLTDMTQFDAVNEIYASIFTDWLPARAVVEVARLPKSAQVGVEAIARVK